jgi:hypothetical protein
VVRIIRKNAGTVPVSTAVDSKPESKTPQAESWIDLAQNAVVLLQLVVELETTIQRQVSEDSGTTVSLDVSPGIRDLYLELIHSSFGYRNTSAKDFRAMYKRLKRVRFAVGWGQEEPDLDEDEKEAGKLAARIYVYAGDRVVGSRRVDGSPGDWQFDTDGWQFRTSWWLFHRTGVRSADLRRTLLEIDPDFASAFPKNKG